MKRHETNETTRVSTQGTNQHNNKAVSVSSSPSTGGRSKETLLNKHT